MFLGVIPIISDLSFFYYLQFPAVVPLDLWSDFVKLLFLHSFRLCFGFCFKTFLSITNGLPAILVVSFRHLFWDNLQVRVNHRHTEVPITIKFPGTKIDELAGTKIYSTREF